MGQLDRRRFLQTSAAVAGSVTYFKNVEALNGYAIAPTIRKNASVMATNDPIMVGYRRAVTKMKNLPDSNPCSWFYQSAIHGTTVTPTQTAWNSCHNDPDFFWAWHRMYLYWFERIVRKFSGMYDWALPYWNWTSSDLDQRKIPAPLRVTTSTLYDGTRNSSLNNGSTGLSSSLGTSVWNTINNSNNYFSAQSSINGPHGSVHGAVGGNMGFVSSAAKDPLFWLHHSEVDRQWNLWLAQGGRSNPVNDADWRNEKFTFFDECCEQVEMSACQILRAAKQLGYVYEDEPTQVNQYCPRILIPIDIKWIRVIELDGFQPFTVKNDSVRQVLKNRSEINLERIENFRNEIKSNRRNKANRPDLVLRLQGIETETQPNTVYEVYLGPEGLKPDPESRYFVGTFGMFSAGIKSKKHHYRPGEYVFPINQRQLARMRKNDYEVIIVPVTGLERDDRKVDTKSELVIQNISIETIAPTPRPDAEEQEQLRKADESGR